MTISCSKLRKKFNKVITVTTNDPHNPTVKLTCAGQILEPAVIQPNRLNFGKISRQTASKKMSVTITKGDGGPITPKIKDADKLKGIDAKLIEVEKGEKYTLEATLVPPFSGKRVTETLEIETGVADAPVVRLPAFATMQPRVVATPYRIQLPAEPQDGWEGRVKLVWDSEPLPKITDVSVNEPSMAVRTENKNGEQWIVVSLKKDYSPLLTARLVTVTTDDKENPSIRIPVVAQRAAAARRARGARGKRVDDHMRKN